MLPEAQKKLKAESVKGTGRCINNITDQLGFTVVLCDICNWVGADKPSRHPALAKGTKKIGMNSHPVSKAESVLTLFFMEDFSNAAV